MLKKQKDVALLEDYEKEFEQSNEQFINAVSDYVEDRGEKQTALVRINNLVSNMNSLVQSSTGLIEKANEFFSLRVELAKINSDTALKLAEIQRSFSEFMTREANKKELLLAMLQTMKERNNRILDKAMGIDLAKCTEREYDYVMKTMDDTQHHLDKIMDIFEKFITSR